MQYVVFDDSKLGNFFPLTYTKAVFDLRIGILKQRQRICNYFKKDIKSFVVWEELEDLYRKKHQDWQVNKISNEDSLFINSRLRINSENTKKIINLEANSCLVSGNEILAARFVPKTEYINSLEIEKLFKEKRVEKIKNTSCWNYLWEIIYENGNFIQQDFEDFFQDKDNEFTTELGVTVVNPYNIWIGEGVEIKPGVVIDAGDGPVVIDENALIMPNAVIKGSVYVGKGSRIKAGAKIYPGTSIGPVCKIGGEVEDTIFQAYSNKQHGGFMGHSYIGEWVNIGAGTNNSDLKNNYNQVRVYSYSESEKIDTEMAFVGCFIGDHSKLGINCTINTGTVIGFGCNLYGRSLIRDFVPSFSWGEYGNYGVYKLENFLSTARIVKKRRNLNLTEEEEKLFAEIKNLEQTNR